MKEQGGGPDIADLVRQDAQGIDDGVALGAEPDGVLAQRQGHHRQRHHLHELRSEGNSVGCARGT